jgi:anti-sigma regulatory factor (Ser/Thr protein kinase)
MTRRRASLALLPTVAAARQARRFVVDTLEGWQLASVIERAELLVSELVSNAIRHAGSGSRVLLVDGPAWVRIEVYDHGPGGAVLRTPGLDELGGRGLLLVQTIADRWGASRRRREHVVWCEIAK